MYRNFYIRDYELVVMGIRLMVSGLDIRVFVLELEEFVISLDYLGKAQVQI